MRPLPVDEILPRLRETLGRQGTVLVEAPPGAGKTTRLPLALLDEPWLAGQQVLLLEPRRLAAVNAAYWMSRSRNETVGGTIGYSIRHEQRRSARTRLEVVTEGILCRRLVSDPFLEGVGLVVFDEFHERNLAADLALALCRELQQTLRPELRLLVMSATLEGERLAGLLGDAPVLRSSGRSHPVTIRYLDRDLTGPHPETIAREAARIFRQVEGDLLVFLPGVAEIQRCRAVLTELLAGHDAPLVVPLYADLPFAEQERAILPAERRRIVLATTIAETSLTIEGITTVVDAGWSRLPRFEPATALTRLVTVRVSRAAAEQRAGRAGRLGPGTCHRLWTPHTQQGLVAAYPPEILAADLAGLVLDLAAWGVAAPSRLAWLDPPPAAAMAEANTLLQGLGALDAAGRITAVGSRIARLPVHPRLGALLLHGQELGCAPLACDLVALLEERDLFRGASEGQAAVVAVSLLERLAAFHAWQQRRSSEWEQLLDQGACRAVSRGQQQLRRLLGVEADLVTPEPTADLVARLLLRAYPDRVARRRTGPAERYLLAGGSGAELPPHATLQGEELLVVTTVTGRPGREGMIRIAAPLEEGVLRAELPDEVRSIRRVEWSEELGRVQALEETCFRSLVLASRPVSATAADLAVSLLQGLRRQGEGWLEQLPWDAAGRSLRQRTLFLAPLADDPQWPRLDATSLAASAEQWLQPLLSGKRSASDVTGKELLQALQGLFSRQQLRRLEEGAPIRLAVPSGRQVDLEYGDGAGPVLAVKLQELFGLAESPRVAWGKIAVVLHLLSPAGRPLQVTSDLRSFWANGYPQVRKELRGRYPKHPWPEDPWSAPPTARTKRRS